MYWGGEDPSRLDDAACNSDSSGQHRRMSQPVRLPAPVFTAEDFCAGERIRAYKGECLLFERENSSGNCFLILEGSVDVRLMLAGGNEAWLYSLKAGELVGELSLFLERRTATIVAAEDCQLMMIRPSVFWRSYEREEFRQRMTSLFLSRYVRSHDVICRLGQPSVPMKLCRYLLSLPEWRQADGDTLSIELPGREAMSHLLSCQRETVSRSFRKLLLMGLIEQESRCRYRLHRQRLSMFLDDVD